MLKQLYQKPGVIQRLQIGPLGSYINTFATKLSEQGYLRRTIHHKLFVISYMSRWLCRQQLSAKDLDEEKIAKFYQYLQRHHWFENSDPATLRLFLKHLRDIGVIPTPIPKVDDSELGQIERTFTQYLVQERNLSQATLENTLPFVRHFLTERFGSGPILLNKISSQDVTDFILKYAHARSPNKARLMVHAFRSFFRFLYLRADIDINLAAAVPTVPNWKFTNIPKYISPKEVERLLQSCDQNTSKGQRDYAILLLLARLGLRGGEVANMTLDDINWDAGELMVRGKGGLHDQVPIPQDVGEALARYIRYARPRCSTRKVFICIPAPREGIPDSNAIGSIVRRALRRAGLNPAHKGAYLLRHSLATHLLNKGATMAEIAEVLRHRRLKTTEIYAKVDLKKMRRVARPWPGGGS